MDAFVWRLWPVQSRRGILIYLDLRQPYRNLRRQRRHLGSGLNWIYGQHWPQPGLEHERIECENKGVHKANER